MDADAAGQVLQHHAEVDDGAHFLVGVVEALELVLAFRRQGVLERGAAQLFGVGLECGGARDQLGDAVAHAIGLAQHAGDVAHHVARRHAAVGDDLADVVATIALRHVFDDAVATFHAEVDVEVRHRHALGIEKALEQQVVGQRVEVGDAGGIRHQRAGAGTAAGADRHAVALAPGDEVRHHQEVAGEAHLLDDAQLVIQSLPILLQRPRRRMLQQAPFQPGDGQLPQVVGHGDAFRHREVRQVVLAELETQGAAAGDLQGILDRFRQVGEQRQHLFGGFEVLLRRILARATLVVDHPARGDADARLVRLEVLALEKAHIVARHHRQAAVPGKGDGGLEVRFVVGAAAAGDLEIAAVGKMTLPPSRGFARAIELAAEQGHADAAMTPGQGDQAAAGLLQPLPPQLRPAAPLALVVGARDEAGQIAIAGLVLHQQGDALRALAFRPFLQPDVGADHRLDAGGFGELVELDHREQVVLIGDGQGRQAQFGGAAGQRLHIAATALARRRLDPDQAVDQGKLGMQVQMDEAHAATPPAIRACAQGAKLMRCSLLGPSARSASRCCGVP